MILLIGGRGQLGQALQNALPEGSFFLAPPALSHWRAICELAVQTEFDTVINCAAWTDVRGAEFHENRAAVDLLNVSFPGALAQICKKHDKRVITFSTDYVFNGLKGAPYYPDDRPAPINRYGASKYAGEILALQAGAVVIRTAGLFSPYGPNFVHTIYNRLRVHGFAEVTTALVTSVTSADCLAASIPSMRDLYAPGVYHYVDSEPITWYDVACEVARHLEHRGQAQPIQKIYTQDSVNRPIYSALNFSRTLWRDEVARVCEILKARNG